MQEFWQQVLVGDLDECWPWLGRYTRKGYGRCPERFGSLSPHRVAWQLWNEIELGPLHACHECDDPACCNPTHIFPGTSSENALDMHLKGRSMCGMRGRRHTEEARSKMSLAHRENPRRGKRNHMTGNGHLVEGKRNPFYGRRHSWATREKMRAAHAARRASAPAPTTSTKRKE